ncbi:hypothetical protein Mal64_26830 [Pseudobythopirellula maris]|uniref:Retropepsin-like aspartic endopeptidase domain-containing protein n=1 Tax=Pseudobythopirellula maris TaxID=2527991 RepID=A0A5C5ZIY8_9BACT|nr:RimK/LysX family protein [Pseudobythopirellula maris]TWT87148.1 hypothetical protein Mal64_26830 [Pseudobythopirellula maris]
MAALEQPLRDCQENRYPNSVRTMGGLQSLPVIYETKSAERRINGLLRLFATAFLTLLLFALDGSALAQPAAEKMGVKKAPTDSTPAVSTGKSSHNSDSAAESDSIAANAQGKIIIGGTTLASIGKDAVPMVARVDTGAETCSLHAEEVKLSGASRRPSENVGRKITFTTYDRNTTPVLMSHEIMAYAYVRTLGGDQVRYKIIIPIIVSGKEKKVLVTLTDRSDMQHRLLLGRNHLRGDYVVDVEIKGP